MPQTVNGVGTTYYGKKNADSYRGVCESCGRDVILEDYETGYYVCILFIPIIPLGRRQIIGYCPACTRHRAMPVAQWKELKQNAIQQGMEELAANKEDPQAAMKLIGTLTGFNEHQQAEELAEAMQKSFDNNIDVQLFLGAWYDQRGRGDKADSCFARAFEIDPNHPAAIRAQGVGLIEKGRLDEARKLLMRLAPPSPDYDPSIFFLLAVAHQDRNQHEQAMEVFEFINQNTPELSKQKAFRKAVKKTQKQLK